MNNSKYFVFISNVPIKTTELLCLNRFSNISCNFFQGIGFLQDPRRLNVALTRAKWVLVTLMTIRILALVCHCETCAMSIHFSRQNFRKKFSVSKTILVNFSLEPSHHSWWGTACNGMSCEAANDCVIRVTETPFYLILIRYGTIIVGNPKVLSRVSYSKYFVSVLP